MSLFDPLKIIRTSLHELAQPLAALMGLVDLILLKISETHPLYREIQMIDQELTRVLRIIRKIRVLSQETSDKLDSPPD